MNILTFDIEDWYIEKILYGARASKYRQYDEILTKVLDELDIYGIKATFYCVGKLATDFPEVVKTIASRGHEIGCHSNEHIWLNSMTVKELYNDTIEALKALEDVSGQKVVSYRAPAFSITTGNKWAVNVLAECGIESDASIFPAEHDYGGYIGFPQDTPCLISYEGAKLKEYPICLTSVLGRRLAYSGGGYFRVLPYRFVTRTIEKRNYNICYFHLSDLLNQEFTLRSRKEYEEYYKETGTLRNRLVRYVKSNIGNASAFGKMQKLLSENNYVSICDADRMIDWSNMNVIQL